MTKLLRGKAQVQALLMRALRLFRPWPFSGRSAGTFCGSAPSWWQRGWPRQRVGSMAEAELLAPLAELLMPHLPIAELFRSFPSPKGWAGNYLEPDLAAYGVLKDANAGLFVEYDGYWRHGKREGLEMDQKKNEALLMYPPKGSCVIRISHTISRPLQDNVLWVKADTWRSGCPKGVAKIHQDILKQALNGLCLQPEMVERLKVHANDAIVLPSATSLRFINAAVAVRKGDTTDDISWFLEREGFGKEDINLMLRKGRLRGMSIERKLEPSLGWLLSLGLTKSQVAKAVATCPQSLGLSIEQNLNPTVQWLLDLGLTKSQVAKAVATFPHILGYSVEQNLKPTVQWLLDLGLTKSQVAKAVANFPRLLGYSIEQNLKPTVRWLSDLGLTKSQVAKAVATHPQVFGYSIENNLKPTVQWLLNLGLTKSQVAKAVATRPQILGCSIENNLSSTMQWLLDLGLTKSQVAKAVATFPHILGYSVEQNLKPTVRWLLDLGLTKSQVAKAVATCPQIFGYSIENNLKSTVQWLLDLGLTKSQIVKAVQNFPQILGCSIVKNLSPKSFVLNDFFTKNRSAELIGKWPQLLGYSYRRLITRLKILSEQDKTDKLTYAMSLTDEAFQRRFLSGAKKSTSFFDILLLLFRHDCGYITEREGSIEFAGRGFLWKVC